MAATFKNFATTRLTQNLSASATTAYVSSADAAKLPIADGVDSWFYLVIQRATDSSYFEIVKVTNKVDGTLTIVREQEGTIAKAFLLNDLAEARLTTMGLIDAFVGKSDWRLWAVTEAQFEAERAINRRRFAASGYESFGKHENESGQVDIVNQGMNTYSWLAAYANAIGLGRGTEANAVVLSGKSSSRLPVVHVAGCIFTLECLATASKFFEAALVKFPQAPDGKTTYNKTTGVSTIHATAADAFAAQAADPTNVEVVINRVDMWGHEVWAEEVTLANPYIYPNGSPQSQSATMDGIATSDSNRPESYYAFSSGDTSSKGKGLNFYTLTDAQKKKVLANPKNKLVLLHDGRLIQWRLRIRTIAGKGNGDWGLIETTLGNQTDGMAWQQGKYIAAQGKLDTCPEYGTTNAQIFLQYLQAESKHQVGVFSVGNDSSNGINSECYFLVGGTVNRLNQGAYHLSYNPSGTKFLQNTSNPDGGGYWYLADQYKPTSTLECFTKAYALSGNISSAYSGHPDGRHYDAIYADGQGGVCRDMRYSAYGVDLVDFAEADQRVKNCAYRGFEKLIFSKAYAAISSNCTNGVVLSKDSEYGGWVSGYVHAGSGSGLGAAITSNKSNSVYVIKNNSVIAKGYFSGIEETLNGTWFSRVLWDKDYTPAGSSAADADSYLVITSELNISVGGSFLQTDVIGNPSSILATPALTNGWRGSWLPNISNGYLARELTRKSISITNEGSLTETDDGVTFAHYPSVGIYPAANATPTGFTTTYVGVLTYKAVARATEPADNAKVAGAKVGVGGVFYSQIHSMSNMSEMFFGKVLNSWGPNAPYEGERAAEPYIMGRGYASAGEAVYWGKLAAFGDEYATRHGAIVMGAPSSVSNIAFKALNYNVTVNQQAFIQYAYTELKYNGSIWVDDGKVAIFDNQSSKNDAEGVAVSCGTAKLKEPLGWIKNNV